MLGWPGRRILVTGGAGSLGTLVGRLLGAVSASDDDGLRVTAAWTERVRLATVVPNE